MSESRFPTGDRIDRIIAAWQRVRPDLDVTPIAVIARMQIVRNRIEHALSTVFQRHGITEPEFAMLAALVRLGGSAPQHRLADELALSPGTVSVRVDALVERRLAVRSRDPVDGRSTLVSVTDAGGRRFDGCAPEHLAGERRLLSALTEAEQVVLADLLRRLVLSFDQRAHTSGPALELGLELAPAHETIERRRAVGLPERTGLLVRHVTPETAAHVAGIRPGDVVVEAEGVPVRSIVDFVRAAESKRHERPEVRLGIVRGSRRRTCTVRVRD